MSFSMSTKSWSQAVFFNMATGNPTGMPGIRTHGTLFIKMRTASIRLRPYGHGTCDEGLLSSSKLKTERIVLPCRTCTRKRILRTEPPSTQLTSFLIGLACPYRRIYHHPVNYDLIGRWT